jgi:hypothetical protein
MQQLAVSNWQLRILKTYGAERNEPHPSEETTERDWRESSGEPPGETACSSEGVGEWSEDKEGWGRSCGFKIESISIGQSVF